MAQTLFRADSVCVAHCCGCPSFTLHEVQQDGVSQTPITRHAAMGSRRASYSSWKSKDVWEGEGVGVHGARLVHTRVGSWRLCERDKGSVSACKCGGVTSAVRQVHMPVFALCLFTTHTHTSWEVKEKGKFLCWIDAWAPRRDNREGVGVERELAYTSVQQV